jgi:hypothetical protein
MLPVLALLRRRYKINRIRISRNLYTSQFLPTPGVLARKRLYNRALRSVGFKTTGMFTDLETFVRLCSLEPPGKRTVEIMTHPGSEDHGEESRLLDSDWLTALAYQATLISYKAL